MNFTDEQKKVIDIRGTNVLVSAAAGSGKTAVIVERVITRICSDKNDISEMLIVTFTKAAAEEMKGRIREALDERAEALKSDREISEHLLKQLSLIFDAPIMTIDGFCLDVIRNNFNVLDIDPSFRVADEGEIKMLRQMIMDELMERNYEDRESEDFYQFLERFSVKKSDRDVTDAIEQLYDFAVSRPDPEGFLRGMTEIYDIKEGEDIEDNPVLKEAQEITKRKLKAYRSSLIKIIGIASGLAGPAEYIPTLESDLKLVDNLLSGENFSGLYEAFKSISFEKLSPKKSEGEDPALRIKARNIRTGVKKGIESLKSHYYSRDTGQIKEDFNKLTKDARMLSKLTLEFMRDFSEAKKKRNIADFSDIEHTALEMLKVGEVRERYKNAFKEIIVDEYQDSNRLQEEIFKNISNGKNYFCVGDVKQSIYSFRDACPQLFISRFTDYGTEGNDEGKLLLLSKNFRSRKSVLYAVNGLFKNIMHADAGSVEYDEDQYLNFSGVYKKDIPEDKAEFMLALPDAEGILNKDELEALSVAKKIQSLVGVYDIEDKKTGEIRKCGYGDIVILMRALKGRDEVFMDVLLKKGIPVAVDAAAGYLTTEEIRTMMNFLYCIDNPVRDIPLAGTLLGIFGGFDESSLAIIKAAVPEKDLYHALCLAAENETMDEDIRNKASEFLNRLSHYRKAASYLPIKELIALIIRDYNYDNYVRALSEGGIRLKNLNMLLYRAEEFEKTSFKGLFRFIRYIEYVKKYEININKKASDIPGLDCVRIMTIHHSKGLEFPVVFLCGMHRKFNAGELGERLLTDDRLGAGMDIIDIDRRVKTKTLGKAVISDKKKEALFGEELRVLYVAMTRAEQKLIMTGVSALCDEESGTAYAVKSIPSSKEEAGSFGGMLEYALENDEELKSYIYKYAISVDELALGELEQARDREFDRKDFLEKAALSGRERVEGILKDINRSYPFVCLKPAPAKLSVSDLKHEAMEEKGIDLIPAIEENRICEPAFITGLNVKAGGPVPGAVRGSAYHAVFENIDFDKVKDPEGTHSFMEELKNKGVLGENEAKMIDERDITSFALSPLGQRMERALKAGKLFREQPFVILVRAGELSDEYPEDESIMVQGVIDAYFEEEGKLVVVDYKTDRVKNAGELTDRYKAQLDYYAKALNRLTGMDVCEKILYSVTLGREIGVQ